MNPPTASLPGIADLEGLMRQRYSCRAFQDTPVPDATIDRILSVAQLTASWCNSQPWQVIVTSGPATRRFRDALLAHEGTASPDPDIAFPSAYEGRYQERRRACAMQLYEAVGVARGDRAASAVQARENFRLFGAPHVAIVTSPAALGSYGAIDCGGYVSAFMLAATSAGVATIAQASLAAYSGLLHRHFSLPEDRSVVCGISFGFADGSHPANAFRTSRAPAEEVVQRQGC